MKHSVPSRIVLVGSTTQRLSDRFQRLPAPRLSDKMDGPRNFLYDDYMEADFYSQGAVDSFGAGGRGDSFRRRTNARSAIDMPLDTFSSRRAGPSRGRGFVDEEFAPRQPTHARRMASALGIPQRRQRFDDIPPRRAPVRRVIREVVDDDRYGGVEEVVRVVRKPQRIQRERTRTITIVKKVPITQRVSRKPQVVFKKKAGGRPGPSTDRSGPSPRRVKSGGIVKKTPGFKAKKPAKPKANHDQLDAELDAYMRSSKHPRINV
ncbi:unnamed protein product [Bursaphelenchus okinawaensis]|uniref:Chromatin target of PRMT1 protein C-terminal domain-containing protein n=1 Tax=Bursaphelenchus okinawaensis TaxID=465554 RepID=A0A811JRF8_9BILA|nr:unnamed protein product [Bursaphelenchus okinawaensis]CAG9079702.1 unnamed protein product [Bursaphelenchus okinawaensis]